MNFWVRVSAFFVACIVLFAGCGLFQGQQPEPLFRLLDSSQTGISFNNSVSHDIDFNVITFPYIYNGGGVAAGDINKDGLPDLYFTGNMVTSRLYLNQGNMQFRDITKSSGTGTRGWAHGVSMVDIDNDGYLDIYVSMSGPETSSPAERANKLFVNNRDNTFSEQARKFGLADTGYTTHTAFLDYDKDGDLDAFLMNNFPGSFSRDSKIRMRAEKNDGSAQSTDALYQNNGDGTFTDVSAAAGIKKEGYSLGVSVHDYNRDGWPDIYVSNDIQSDDLLYINNGDGTFTDRASDYLKHTSYAGMGSDAADFNNDGWPDIMQVDMMPPTLEEQQKVTGASDYEHYKELLDLGYMPQYPLNTLQLSNGIESDGDIIFSEIAKLAGVGYTNWSWSALFGDYDSDGFKDLMITNGYPKNVNNYDYIINLNRAVMFGDDGAHKKTKYNKINQLDSIKIDNYMFRNRGDLTFEDKTEAWGLGEPSFSYGTAQVDLDNDLDLDIVISNTNDEAFIYENRSDTLKSEQHNLVLKLQGDSLNTYGIGSKVIVDTRRQKQYRYLSPYRGYQSSMEHSLHFGLGANSTVDSLKVIWPDGSYQLLRNIKADQQLTLKHSDAKQIKKKQVPKAGGKHFVDWSINKLNINFRHQENEYNDFEKEPLLPHMLSRLGPGIAVSDVNNDSRDDFFVGGAAGSAGRLYLQEANGSFRVASGATPWNSDKAFEDVSAVFFDANSDGNPDLYIVSGGNEFSPASGLLQDRLYLNTGNGQFVRSEDALPDLLTSGSTVKPADYDGDGDPDLFVGGRLVPGQYPRPADSYILQNEEGTFNDITPRVAPEFKELGQVTDAEWIDFDGDEDLDLVIAGVWMPISFYQNNDGKFEDVTETLGLKNRTGWWYSLEKGDFDKDGDEDLVAGNLGLNSNYKTDDEKPLEIYASDFDGNHVLDAILSVEKNGEVYPLAGMRALDTQMSGLMRKFQSFEAYASASLSDIVGAEKLEEALHYKANTLASYFIENEGDNRFNFYPLHKRAQFSTINDIITNDVNGDGNLDIIVGGNLFNTAPKTVRNDQNNGLLLLGDGAGSFRPISAFKSGLVIPHDVKELAPIQVGDSRMILVANNDDSLQVIKLK